jgi:signal transduction histidine kinase
MISLQQQLIQAQKLEAIGQLAAGIAHEINTPMQYVQNNVAFIEQAVMVIQNLLIEVRKMESSQLTPQMTALLGTIDFDFLLREIPESFQETHLGLNRVVKIVSAMKEFSHPGGKEMVLTDLNRALDSTITVCRNEWKYIAEMKTDFDKDLPLISCFPDQLNQAILNLIINSVHAIQSHEAFDALNKKGEIAIVTRREDSWVEIQISDNGCGIQPILKKRIFDPFFTTKEVGKGTGQGLAIAHDIIVNKHRGQIDFTSTPGQGTTFYIRLQRFSEQGEYF